MRSTIVRNRASVGIGRCKSSTLAATISSTGTAINREFAPLCS
jgi:hypothetical protein